MPKNNRSITVASNLTLPSDAATETIFICGTRGSGKSHTASVCAEGMLKHGQPIVVYDPTGAWWGLKSSADGKRPGYPVIVFGGDHADVPLEETAGSLIASVIVEKRIPAILDVSRMRKGARTRFMLSFCETLYTKNSLPLHLFLDEAHTVAPQKLISSMPDQARLLGAVEDIVLQGRRFGLGCTAISQRPALLNKNISTQCQTIIAMRMTAPIDIKVVREWVELHADVTQAKAMIASLPSLKTGVGWVWSPAWLDFFDQVRFRGRETFDSSATPKVGDRVRQPKLAAVDPDWLKGELAATAESAKANDPKELRRQIEELRKELSITKGRAAKPTAVAAPAKAKSVLQARDAERLEKSAEKLNDMGRKILAFGEQVLNRAGSLAEVVAASRTKDGPAPHGHNERHELPVNQPHPAPSASIHRRQAVQRAGYSGASELKTMPRAFLTALAQHPGGMSKGQLLTFTGYASSGTVSSCFADLVRDGHAYVRDRGSLAITAAGEAVLGTIDPLPTGAALRDMRLNHPGLGAMGRVILSLLFEHYPDGMAKGEILRSAGYSSSGTTSSMFSKLVRLGWAVKSGQGRLKASDMFFKQ